MDNCVKVIWKVYHIFLTAMCYTVIFFNHEYIQLFVGNVPLEYASCIKLFAKRQGSSRWEFHCFIWTAVKRATRF